MSTPPDPNKGAPTSDTLVSDRPPIEEDEREKIAPYNSEEATAINHQVSGESDSDEDDDEPEEIARFNDPAHTLAAAELYVDPGVPGEAARGEISGKNAAAPVVESSGATPRAPEAPTLVHQTSPIDDDEAGDADATERLPAPAPPTQVGPLPDRSPGASVMDGAVERGPVPQVQAWKVVPTGQTAIPIPSPPDEVEPPKPRGLQTVLWNMTPVEDDEDDEVTDHGRDADPYPLSGGTIARAAQTYIMEAMEMIDGLKEFCGDLDEERSRELLSGVTGCNDRLRRSLALLATADDGDE